MNKSRNWTHTPEFGEAIRQGLLKHYALHPVSQETKDKIRQSNTGKARTEEYKKNMSLVKTGMPSPNKGKSIGKGILRNSEARRNISLGRLKYFQEHPEAKENLSKKLTGQKYRNVRKSLTRSMNLKGKQNALGKSAVSKTRSQTHKQLWQDPRHIVMMIKARNQRPNKAELRLEVLLNEWLPNQFAYNGDFSLGITIGRQIPDFVNINGKKQVIELFGDFWHQSPDRGAEAKTERYNKLGWQCLIIWQSELKDTCVLKEKVMTFAEGGATLINL